MFGNVLVAFDGAARARKAANVAIDLAGKCGAPITFLTVIQIEFTAAGHPARPAGKVWLSVGWSAAAPLLPPRPRRIRRRRHGTSPPPPASPVIANRAVIRHNAPVSC